MTLHKIIRKKNLVIVGLNSGTSADGLDLAAIGYKKSRRKPIINFIGGRTVPYSRNINIRINNVLSQNRTPIENIIELDRQLGAFYGKEAGKFCTYLRRIKVRPDLIASHGQTILHLPGKVQIGRKKESGTLQLGHPESIARQTGLVTVADFRQADIASGGEGAPITSLAMYYISGDTKESRLIINIGGIANYFLFPKGAPTGAVAPKGVGIKGMKARDCGPGNSLLDIITRKYFGKKYDNKGSLASKGKISKRMLSVLMADNYLKGKYGPSTGRERFGEKFGEKIMKLSSKLRLNKHDILTTVTELTAVTIAAAIKPHLAKFKINDVYLFGGGAKNIFLIDRLTANLSGIKFYSVDRLGFKSDYLEAACYAVMGGLTICSKPTGVPQITGAAERTISGRIIQPFED
jgi:anhydro-N-acetylmuramic acid kinase